MPMQRNWADANKYCQSNNMKLVAIESGYENDLLYNELIKYGERYLFYNFCFHEIKS